MPALISRTEALQRGLKRYFTGRPCLRGHVAERRVKGRICVTCGALENAARRAADLEGWRKANRERNRRRDPQVKRARDRACYARNPQVYIAKTKRWQEKNREHWLAWRRQNRRNKYIVDRIRTVLRASVLDAKQQGLAHDLSYNYLWAIWTDACPVFSVPFFTNNADGNTPVVVPIDQALGYTKGNVIVLSKDAVNLRKGTAPQDWADWLRCLIRS